MPDKPISGLDSYPGFGLLPAAALLLVRNPVDGKDYKATRDRLSSSHAQNTDLGTNNDFFEVGRLELVDATGAYYRGLVINKSEGEGRGFLGARVQGEDGLPTFEPVFCRDFVPGSPANVFEEFGSGGGGGGPFTLNVTETIGGLTPGTYTDTADGFITRMAVRYQTPGFTFFHLQGQSSRNEEVGTSIPAGFKSFTWGTSNSQNVQAGSLTLQDLTAGTQLAAGEDNDGSLSASTAAFTVVAGESRRYRLTGQNTNDDAFTADLTITGFFRAFYDSVASAPASSADVRALANNFLIGGGGQLTLNTGTSNRRFAVWLPAGHSITSVIDQDALNADITSQYAGSALSVNDAGGTPRAGTLYVMTQAVAYSSSHRHLISFN